MVLSRNMFVLVFALAAQLLIVVRCQSTQTCTTTGPPLGPPPNPLPSPTPLDDYVNKKDGYFNWTLIQTYDQTETTLYILNYTSQKWFDETFSTQPIWWHYLSVCVPKCLIRPKSAFLFIDGGFNTDPVPTPSVEYVSLMCLFAESTGSIGFVLHDNPNQPIRFLADPSNTQRIEDAIIAWTWKLYIANQSDPNVILQVPMAKAAVGALNAVQQFTAGLRFHAPHKCPGQCYPVPTTCPVPETFIVAGYSKRGWATWLTAAVDRRVFAAAPIVLDGLNFQANIQHHYRSLDGLSFALADYVAVGINQVINSANLTQLLRIVDPYNYLNRYYKTKILQIQTINDEFFLPDNEILFWPQLQAATGGSFLSRIPNTDHSFEGRRIEIFNIIKAFYVTLYDNQPLPSLNWTLWNNCTHGGIVATVDYSVGPAPIKSTLYYAPTLPSSNRNARDFRLFILDPLNPANGPVPNLAMWITAAYNVARPTPTTVVYSVTFANPSKGWLGFYFEVDFPGPHGTAHELTTQVQIVPTNTYAVSGCLVDPCPGTLV